MADNVPASIDEFAAGADKLRRAVEGLSRDDLTAFPVPGTWSIHQIVLHMQDSDGIGIDRMKRLAAEENPLLIGYDETKFAQRLYYHNQSIEDALALFEINRRQFVRVLKALPAEAFDRAGIHNEIGKVTLGVQLKKYNEHLEHHLRFIYDKRKKLGK